MSVNCVYCGHVNPDGTTVCLSCGRTLPPPPAGADSYGQQSWGQPPAAPPAGQPSYPPADPYGGSYPPAQTPGSWQQPDSYGQQQQGYGAMTPPGSSFGQPPAPWQAPAGGYGGFAAVPPEVATAQKQAKAAMICAIVGIFCCQVVLGPIGLVLGIMSKSTLNKYNVQEGQGFALTGIILGIIDLVIFVLYLIISIAVNS